MALSRDRLVRGAMVLSESAWLFAAFGVIGTVVDKGGSPLGWFAVLAIMAISFVLVLISPANASAVEVIYLVRSLIGAAVIYVAVGAHLGDGLLSVDLGWLSTLISGEASPEYSFTAVLGAAFGAALWWRGDSIAGLGKPTKILGISFRIGMIALALAVVVDVAHPDSLNTSPMVFIFFAAGLGGLSSGNLWPQSQASTSVWLWPRVISGVVASVVLIGAAATLLKKGPLTLVGAPVLSLIESVAKLVFFAIFVPVVYVSSVLLGLFLGLFDEPFDPEIAWLEPERSETAAGGLAVVVDGVEREASVLDQVIVTLAYLFAISIVAVIAFLLLRWVIKQLRRMYVGQATQLAGKRESVREEGELTQDIGKLLSGLMPDLSKLSWRRSAYALPDGPPGIVDALRLYYDILAKAEDRGVRRSPHETPAEHRSRLEEIFPVELVRQSTDAFVRAFYGNHPTPVEQLSAMTTTLKGLKWEVEQS